MELFKPVERKFDLKIGNGSGKVDILMKKSLPGIRWSSLGRGLRGNDQVISSKDKEVHDLFTLQEKYTQNQALETGQDQSI